LSTSSRSIIPYRRSISACNADRFGCVRQLLQRRHEDPRLAVFGPDPHATRAAGPDRVVQPAERGVQPLLEIGDEHRRVKRLADRCVVHGPVALEVGRQVLVRVAPAAGPVDVDLAAADRVAKRPEHT
jgi:hypothetical protein